MSEPRSAARPRSKIFNDPIHGHMRIHPLCVKIIDTPQFQRLRFLSQLGGVYFVFPGASHKRFEHSLGVCHLAGVLVDTLAARQPELGVTPEDRLCVRIAGLCHDLGHGPLSHLFDRMLIRTLAPGLGWEHEHASAGLLEHLIRENGLEREFARYGLGPVDVHFIQELIFGHPDEAPAGWEWRGRGAAKQWLFDIVANKKNGVDVDRMDYFARDCSHLNIRQSFDEERLALQAAVCNVDGAPHIAFRTSEAFNLYEFFHTRFMLHKRAYQHRVARVVELMFTEALMAANDHIRIPGKDGVLRRMSECVEDMVAYTLLDDTILRQIEASPLPELAPARALIARVRRRQLYVCVGEVLLSEDFEFHAKESSTPSSAGPSGTQRRKMVVDTGLIRAVIASLAGAALDTEDQASLDAFKRLPRSASLLGLPPSASSSTSSAPLGLSSPSSPSSSESSATAEGSVFGSKGIIVEVVTLSHGTGQANPLDSVAFFSGGVRDEPDDIGPVDFRAVRAPESSTADEPLETFLARLPKGEALPKNKVSHTIPAVFEERFVRVYSRSRESGIVERVRRAFRQWCESHAPQLSPGPSRAAGTPYGGVPSPIPMRMDLARFSADSGASTGEAAGGGGRQPVVEDRDGDGSSSGRPGLRRLHVRGAADSEVGDGGPLDEVEAAGDEDEP